MDIKSRVSLSIAKKLAGKISKEGFLSQLASEWVLHLPEGFDVEDTVRSVREQIRTSGSEDIFGIVGIKDEDIRSVLIGIKEGRSESK